MSLQSKLNVIVKSTTQLEIGDNGLYVLLTRKHFSSLDFSSDDVVHGFSPIVEAVAHSKVVAEPMHRYMQSLND